MDCLPAPAHLFTLGGNSIACAAGSAAFDVYKTDAFQKQLEENIRLTEKLAAGLQKKHGDIVTFVRQLGMSMGIGVQGVGGESDLDAVFKILFRCYQTGLIIISVAGNILRIQPPLNITAGQLEKGFAIMDAAMEDYKAGRISDDVLKYRAGW